MLKITIRKKKEKPLIDQRDMTGFMSIIIAFQWIDSMILRGMITFTNKGQIIAGVVFLSAFIAAGIFWISQKILCVVNKKTKRKSHRHKANDLINIQLDNNTFENKKKGNF